MNKKAIAWLTFLMLLSYAVMAQDATVDPFRGGHADGHSMQALSNFTQANSNNFSPFIGGNADGYAHDSMMAFNPRSLANNYSPFAGGIGDGYAHDSLIAFNQLGYITMFNPFAGGVADGYHEGVICTYPAISGDTSVFLQCSNDLFNLDSLVFNYNFAGRWNTPDPSAVIAGTYELRINNAGKCLDTATVHVMLDVATWMGAVSDDWHTAANWNTNRVPTGVTHVIIPNGTANACLVKNEDAVCASVQARTGGNIQTINNRILFIQGRCASLPTN